MKPMISNNLLRDVVVKELDSDPEVIAKHVSVSAIDGAVTLGAHVMTIQTRGSASSRACLRGESSRR